MKKIFLLLLIFISFKGFGQGFPGVQGMASPTTRLEVKGGLHTLKGLINATYTDTTAANADYIDFYTGAQIYTSSDNNFWLRIGDAWVRLAKFTEIGAGTGTVTSISQGYGILNTPDPITTTGTIEVDTATLSDYFLSQGFTDGDTTIFETVIDSTAQPGQRVLFAGGNNNIRSDSYFLFDSVNNKLMINHFNISAGGANTKLFVGGNTTITGSLTVQGMAAGVGTRAVRIDLATGLLTYADTTIGGAGVSDGDKGDITVTGSGATWTIDNDVVTFAKMQDISTATFIGRNTALTGDPEELSIATAKTMLNLAGTNTGDQTSIVGITGTKAEFNTALTDGDFLFVGDAVTAETDPLSIHLTGTNTLTGDVTVDGSDAIDFTFLVNNFDVFANQSNGYAQLFGMRPGVTTSRIVLTHNNNTTSEAGFTSLFSTVSDTTAEFTLFATPTTPSFTKGGSGYGSYIRLTNRQILINPHSTGGRLQITNLITADDTTNYKPLARRVSDSTVVQFDHWPTGGGGGENLQQTLDLGSTLTDNETIATGANNLTISTATAAVNPFAVSSTTGTAIAANATTGSALNIGSAGSTATLFLTKTTTATNSSTDLITGVHATSGVAAAGFGSRWINGWAEVDDGSLRLQGYIGSDWVDPALATYTSQVNIAGADNTATEIFMNIQKDLVRINNNADTLATKAYARSVGGGGGGGTGSNLSWDGVNHEVDIDGGGTSAIIPYATASVDGLVSIATQSFAGYKTFTDGLEADGIESFSLTGFTNVINYGVALRHESTGTPANGFGVGVLFSAETTVGNVEQGAAIDAVITDVTALSEDFDFVVKLMAAGAAAAEKFRVISDGTIKVQTINQDDAETKMMVWNSTDKVVEWRDASTLGGGSGTVNAGAALKAAYYPAAATTVDDWIGVEFNNTNLNTKIIAQAATDVLLELRMAAVQTADPFVIKNSAGNNIVQFQDDGKAFFTSDGTASLQNVDGFDNVFMVYGGGNVQLQLASGSAYAQTMQLLTHPAGFQGGLGGGNIGMRTNNALNFTTNALVRATINATGEFLIATTTDGGDGKLQVNGNVLMPTGFFEMAEQATPATPAAGFARIYPKADNLWYGVGEDGVEVLLSNAAGGGMADPGGNGIVVRTALNTTINRTLTGTANRITISDGDGVSGNPTFDIGTDVVTLTGTQTVTNKRVTKRTGTVASSATPTINTDNVDFYSITALAVNITSMTTNLSGTPTDGQTLWIAITDDGTARTITWGASFESSTVNLPTTTIISTRIDVGVVWNTVTNRWRCVATQ